MKIGGTGGVVSLALLVTLYGCSNREDEIRAKVAQLEATAKAAERARQENEVAEVKRRLLASFEEHLKDPGSVQYRGVVVKLNWLSNDTGGKAHAVCGQFNAKNSMGGYTGFDTFVVYKFEGGQPRIWTTGDKEPARSIARKTAADIGCST